jgi:hypothetical protein
MERRSLAAFQDKMRTKQQSVALYCELMVPATTGSSPQTDTTSQQYAETRNATSAIESSPLPTLPVAYVPRASTVSTNSKTSLTPQSRAVAIPTPRSLAPANRFADSEKAQLGGLPAKMKSTVQTNPRKDSTTPANPKLTGTSWIAVYDGLTAAIRVRHYSPGPCWPMKPVYRNHRRSSKTKTLRCCRWMM